MDGQDDLKAPKMCLEVGRGVAGAIGMECGIAARAVAQRIAEELGVEPGGAVGHQVGFTQMGRPATRWSR